MNWKIPDWVIYVVAAIAEASNLMSVVEFWGTPAAIGFLFSFIWLFLLILTHWSYGKMSQAAQSALAGWKETLDNNDTLIQIAHGLKNELREKDRILSQRKIAVVVAEKPTKKLKVNTKRRKKTARK